MKSKIIKQEKNPLLHREEILMEIEADSNPNLEDVKKEIGKDAELTVVKKIENHFGSNRFIADVVVYDNKEFMKRIEPVSKKSKEGGETAPDPAPEVVKVEEAPKVEEKPVEETKEEVKGGKEDGKN